MATYRRSTTERWLLVVHMQSHSSPPFPPFPLPLFTWARLVKEKKEKEKIRKALIQQNGLCLRCTSQPGSIPRSCAFYRSTTFFFFSGKQIHARNHSKPSVLFRSHTHTHTRYWENAFRAQVSAINNALVILLAGFPETCSPPHHLNQFTFCTDASPGLSSK